jgi:DNA-binding transcriptional regulator GbsR (MarR family)
MSAVERFIEDMGIISQESGAPRIGGRIIGLLMVEGQAMSLQQISERLAVSRASISTNARDLAKRGMLRRITRAGDRQDYYEAVDHSAESLSELARQFRRNAVTISSCVPSLELEAPDAAPRVIQLADFYAKSADNIQNWANAMRGDVVQNGDKQ